MKNFDESKSVNRKPAWGNDSKMMKEISNNSVEENIFENFCSSTSLHGVTKAHEAGTKHAKFFWIIVLLIATCGLITILIRVIYGFFLTPTATSNVVEHLDEMPFPDIVICQNRPLNDAYLKRLNISEDLAYYVQLVLGESVATMERFYRNDTKLQLLEKSYQELLKHYPERDIRNFFMEAGPPCHDLLRMCVVRGYRQNCCQMFRPVFDAQNGRCFLYTGNGTAQHYENIGIDLVISLFPNKYFPALTTNSKGATVKISPQYRPFAMRSVRIPLGGYAEIELDYKIVEWSNSMFKTKCHNNALHSTFGECGYHCKHKMKVKYCGCSGIVDIEDLEGKEYNRTREVCSPKLLFECVSNGSSSEEWLKDYNKCRRACLPRCTQTIVSPTVSYSTYAPDPFIRASFDLKENETMEMVFASIFYANFRETRVTEVATITPESIVGNIGGAMGVFLGASLVSLIEIAELLGKYVIRWNGGVITTQQTAQ